MIIMILNDAAVAKQRAFERAYMFAEPYSGFVNGCSLQTVDFLREIHGYSAVSGRPENLCLYVFLERPLSHGMHYPKEFDGMPVIARVVGEIREEEPIYESRDEV